MNYKEFVARIAKDTYLPEETIKVVVQSMVEIITATLQTGNDEVIVTNFGKWVLTNKTSRAGKYRYPKFRSAIQFRERTKQEAAVMNKYGVVLDENKTLLAKLSGECPKCLQPLKCVIPPECTTCGTKPFESTPQKEDTNG